ncbi:MAG: sodium:calcium antiporter, partial [Deltaproteobacteria bacterium]
TARSKDEKKTSHPPEKKTFRFIIQIVIGMAGLLAGANLIVRSAIFIARHFGLSEVFIGLSIVAVGTSLPELATSVVAGIREEHDISIGNVVGSNIFNICLVIGTVGLFNPMPVDPGLLRFEFPAMFFLAVMVFVFARAGASINRLQGLFFAVSFFLFVGVSYWIGS